MAESDIPKKSSRLETIGTDKDQIAGTLLHHMLNTYKFDASSNVRIDLYFSSPINDVGTGRTSVYGSLSIKELD